jgi:hypothetical protein
VTACGQVDSRFWKAAESQGGDLLEVHEAAAALAEDLGGMLGLYAPQARFPA